MQKSTAVVSAVPEQIAERAKLQPYSIALHNGDEDLSYCELEVRADQFANYLRGFTCVSGGTVAICMDRSPEWIIAALGIMRAGATYVPLDPTWPDARLRFAISDSGAVALVARASTLERLQISLPGIDPFRDAAAVANSAVSIECSVSWDSLAYVIYTSGSTGTPKGVEITQANLANVVQWHRQAFGVTRQDRASHLLGLGFDAAALEIWAHLCAGATLCLPSEHEILSPELIQAWIIRERVTIVVLPAILGARLMTMEWPSESAVRILIVGGDVLHHGPPTLLPFKVVNHYGPTECTVVTTWATLTPGSDELPPIGCPIAGATVYLLDDNGMPVPDGTVGEIYIGGSGVGRGYRNLPHLTGQSFLPDPFSAQTNSTMYRTGDLGKRRTDGQLQFCGRRDRQVKIRGQRIELDEIGSVLSQYPSIDFATVVTSLLPTGEKQLVAYVLLKESEREPSSNDIQAYLLRSMPAHMVPAVFVRMDHIPLSANGKVDLTLFPSPSDLNLLSTVSNSGRATQLEIHLLDMMRDLLDGKTIRVGDNFFLAGGDSLLGMQLMIMMRDEFGVDLTFDQVFQAATVGDLAVLIEKSRENARSDWIQDDLPGSEQAGLERSDNLDVCKQGACSQRIGESKMLPRVFQLPKSTPRSTIFWVHYPNISLSRALGQDHHMIFLTLTPGDTELLGQTPSLESIAARLVQDILAAEPCGPYMIGGFCIGGVLAYEVAVQLRRSGHAVAFLVLVDPPAPSDLKSGRPPNHDPSNLSDLLRKIARSSQARKWQTLRKMIADAAPAYRGERYEGKVLMLLASDPSPRVNLLLEWQAIIPNNLQTEYVAGHHSDLMKPPYVQNIADAIASHLGPPPG